MSRSRDKLRVLAVGHRIFTDTEFAEPNHMAGSLVLLSIVASHQKQPGWNQRHARHICALCHDGETKRPATRLSRYVPIAVGHRLAVQAQRARQKKAAEIFDNQFVDDLEKSGFLKGIWGGENYKR